MLTLLDSMTNLSNSHIQGSVSSTMFSSINSLHSLSVTTGHSISHLELVPFSHVSCGLPWLLSFTLLIGFVQTDSVVTVVQLFILLLCSVFPFPILRCSVPFHLIPMSFHHTIPGSFTTGPCKGGLSLPYPHARALGSTVMPSGIGAFERQWGFSEIMTGGTIWWD